MEILKVLGCLLVALLVPAPKLLIKGMASCSKMRNKPQNTNITFHLPLFQFGVILITTQLNPCLPTDPQDDKMQMRVCLCLGSLSATIKQMLLCPILLKR